MDNLNSTLWDHISKYHHLSLLFIHLIYYHDC